MCLSMDVGTQLPHGAAAHLRDARTRAVDHQPATAADLAEAMSRLCTEKRCEPARWASPLRALLGHQSITRAPPFPGTFAANDELSALGRAVASVGGHLRADPRRAPAVAPTSSTATRKRSLESELEWMDDTLARSRASPSRFLMFEFDDATRRPTVGRSSATRRGQRGAARSSYVQIAGRPTGMLHGLAVATPFPRAGRAIACWPKLPFEARMA